MGRRLECPISGHSSAFVVLPDEWLGKHALRRDDALRSIQTLENKTVELGNAVMALCLADDWGGIPGIEGKDPANWVIEDTPLSLINWLSDAVITDFNAVFTVPKNFSEPLPTVPQVAAKKKMTK